MNTRPASSGPIRILLADDDRAVLGVLNSVVRFLGHMVIGTAVNKKECFRAMEERRPDLVLLDFSMAGSEGVATAEEIMEKWNVPVIVTTGSLEIVEQLRQAPIAGYLAKPFKLETIGAAIEAAVGGDNQNLLSARNSIKAA